MQNCTIVVVAHRVSTIQNANMIAVLKNGAIVEQGTHRALLYINSLRPSVRDGARVSH
jgi:ABC-type transport system involved in Fe-S cluster assembly fused permease/ATPase subunit